MSSEQEVRSWLGDFADDPTQTQMAQLVVLFTVIEQRWSDPDEQQERTAALNGATQIVLGDDTLEKLTDAWQRAADAEREAAVVWTGAVLASATGARSGPGSEADLIARTGKPRATVRRALGRRP